MKSFLPLLVSLAMLTASCSKCKCDDPIPDEFVSGSGLPGHWKLVHLQCYCAPGPTPNERLAITPTGFAEYKDGARILDATYTIGTTTVCGLPGTSPALNLVRKMSPISANINAGYTLSGDTLVLDYGSPCDAPRKTYRRVR